MNNLKIVEDKIDKITKLTEEIMNDIWNEAIDQCLVVNAKYGGSTEVDVNIRKLKR